MPIGRRSRRHSSHVQSEGMRCGWPFFRTSTGGNPKQQRRRSTRVQPPPQRSEGGYRRPHARRSTEGRPRARCLNGECIGGDNMLRTLAQRPSSMPLCRFPTSSSAGETSTWVRSLLVKACHQGAVLQPAPAVLQATRRCLQEQSTPPLGEKRPSAFRLLRKLS